MVEAIIFDCDGVLVDSEPLAWQAWRDVLGRYGVEVTDDDVRRLTGRRQADLHASFAARAPIPPFADLYAEVSSALFELFERELRPFSDAIETIDGLRAGGFRLAVASSSPRARLDRMLALAGLSDAFDASVAGDEVDAGKPEPDLFVRAAALLGLDAGTCTAVEDTPAGVASARAAGMCVVAVVRGHVDRAGLAAAHRVIDSLDAEAIVSAC